MMARRDTAVVTGERTTEAKVAMTQGNNSDNDGAFLMESN
jgi:hypothetical protein